MPITRWHVIETISQDVRPIRSKGNLRPFCGECPAPTERPDPLRRFAATPLATDLQLMQRTVCLETNSSSLLALALKFYERHQHGRVEQPQFRWSVVCEGDPQLQSTAVPLSAFSDRGLRFVNIGRRSYLAVDLNKREAKAFLADAFIDSEARFRHRPPLDILFCLTAASLGLLPLSAGCVGVEDRGVLVFGPPNSGKTTACYLAATLGMEFHADQVVFLDMDSSSPRAWGDPFPAVFRPETLDFLPELRQSTHRSTYADLVFYYFDKGALQASRAHPVTPVCSVFLDRGGAREARVKEIAHEDAAARLRDSMLFSQDSEFDSQISAALSALSRGPVYELQYGSDPRIAAAFLEKLLR